MASMAESGAMSVSMSGSGATVFGVFDSLLSEPVWLRKILPWGIRVGHDSLRRNRVGKIRVRAVSQEARVVSAGFQNYIQRVTTGASPNGKAAAFGAAICRFESYRPSHSLDRVGPRADARILIKELRARAEVSEGAEFGLLRTTGEEGRTDARPQALQR